MSSENNHENESLKAVNAMLARQRWKAIKGWGVFLGLVVFSGVTVDEMAVVNPEGGVFLQFIFCGIAWLAGGHYMSID